MAIHFRSSPDYIPEEYYSPFSLPFTTVQVTLSAASDGLVTSFGKRDRWVSVARNKHRSIIFSSA